ncbi:MAG: glycosyltransferase family 87 protein, partial [Microbacteriaceae bacterium]
MIALICAHELLTAQFSFQFNIGIAAIIAYSFILIDNRRDFWAAALIALGTFTKIYGIVGLAFFPFSKHKFKFIVYLLFWFAFLGALPMLFFGPDYIVASYADWLAVLQEKNLQNVGSTFQDISVMGMLRRIGSFKNLNNWVVI